MDDTLKKFRLSKSRLMRGFQCAKSLYLTFAQPELEPPVSDAQQSLFDQGHAVGTLAQREFSDGVLIKAPYYDPNAALAETQANIDAGATTIFEGTFTFNDVLVKVDILNRESLGAPWHLIEVKSSTSVKPEQVLDTTVQRIVVEGAGQPIKKASIMYLNRDATAPDLSNLFRKEDVSQETLATKSAVSQKIEDLKAMLAAGSPPKVDIGPHCTDPYECPFKTHCWKHVPEGSVFEFPRVGPKAWTYYQQGVLSMDDPRFGPFKDTQAKRLHAIQTKERWIDIDAVLEVISSWKWPLIHLDFETIGFAIPRYPGTKPYQQIPFQFSCLRQETPDGPTSSLDFLHDSQTDPREPLAKSLVQALAGPGSIVAYNMGFEAGCIEDLAAFSPIFQSELLEAKGRLVDPLPIFRSAIYDREFKGSFSIKSVAPAILGQDRTYKGMEIADGKAAQRGFIELIDPSTPNERRNSLREGMLEYCRKDTIEMMDLVNWLFQIAPPPVKKAAEIK